MTMNSFEAGIISAIPVGGIIGGILCKSYGMFAITVGVIAGMVSGGIVGWIYALVVLAITAALMGIWQGIRGLPDFDFDDADNEELNRSMNRNSEHGIVWGVVSGCAVGFLIIWWVGVLFALILTLLNAITVVIVWHCGVRKIQKGKCSEKVDSSGK